MAADGTHGPKPYTKHQLSTTFLRVPLTDWPAVKRGIKREFRSSLGRGQTPQLWKVPTPMLVIAYAIRRGEYDARPMVLEEAWQEPLGAISQESLQREGFESLAEFRRYWLEREHVRFRPTRQIFCFRVRPYDEGRDRDEVAQRLLDFLYGEFLEAA